MSLRRFWIALVTVLLGTSIALWGVAGGASSGGVKPKPGIWNATIVKGATGSGASGSFKVNNAAFSVSSNHTKVSRFGFSFSYAGPIKPPSGMCQGSGVSAATRGSAIKRSRFSTPSSTSWTGAGSATYHGVFDSARRAHGTAVFQVFISGTGCQFSGTASTRTVHWRAKR